MATVTYLGESYTCATAIKGDDYIHLLNDEGIMCTAFDGITDFTAFTITDGAWAAPTAENECYVAVIRDDGTIGKGGHTCHDIGSHASRHASGGSDPITPAAIGAAAASHNHSATEITSGTLPIARGGTGATTKANARKNIGVYVQSSAPSGASGDLWAW